MGKILNLKKNGTIWAFRNRMLCPITLKKIKTHVRQTKYICTVGLWTFKQNLLIVKPFILNIETPKSEEVHWPVQGHLNQDKDRSFRLPHLHSSVPTLHLYLNYEELFRLNVTLWVSAHRVECFFFTPYKVVRCIHFTSPSSLSSVIFFNLQALPCPSHHQIMLGWDWLDKRLITEI